MKLSNFRVTRIIGSIIYGTVRVSGLWYSETVEIFSISAHGQHAWKYRDTGHPVMPIEDIEALHLAYIVTDVLEKDNAKELEQFRRFKDENI